MNSGDYLQPNSASVPTQQQQSSPSHSRRQSSQQFHVPSLHQQQPQQQQQQQQQQQSTLHQSQNRQPPSPSLSPSDDPNHPPASPPQLSLQPSLLNIPQSFPQGEDLITSSSNTTAKNVTLSTRIGSTGSQLISPINEVRKRTGRRAMHRPRPLDLDHARLHRNSNQNLPTGITIGSSSDSKLPSATSASVLGHGQGIGSTGHPGSKKHKFPLLHIKTDFHRPTNTRRAAAGPGISPQPTGVTSSATPGFASTIHNSTAIGTKEEVQKKAPSQWQVGLERMLKKIQRRNRAPSNLVWYAAHSTQSYLSGATLESRPGALKQTVDNDMENLYFGRNKPPKWVVDSLQDEELFFSDDTVDLVLGLRDYLIKATESGWDIRELNEETLPVEPRFTFLGRSRNRSASPHGSPRKASPHGSPGKGSPNEQHPQQSSTQHQSTPVSPGAVSQESGHSNDADNYFQQTTGRYIEEAEGSYRLLDYFIAVMSDIISHDCRYMVQNPRPSRPEWILHSFVLDILFLLAKSFAHDHKAIYDVGMIALSAFPIFKSHALVRLLDLMADVILPSFATSRGQYYASLSRSRSPPITPMDSASPISPSEIRVQLDNNQTFAIQVHSPTEEEGLLAVPRQRKQSFNSPRIPSPRSSSTSMSISGYVSQAQDILDTYASSLIQLTLLSVLQQISFSKSPLPVVKQVEKSIGALLRIKTDLSVDLLEVISIVENEKAMRRAVEALWWIGKPSLGHLTLTENFFPIDYDSIMAMRQNRQEWSTSNATINGVSTDTIKSDTLFSFRRGSLDGNSTPISDIASRNNSFGTFRILPRKPYQPGLPWKIGHKHSDKTNAQQEPVAISALGTDYLAEHELYPYMFSTEEEDIGQEQFSSHKCERCETIMHGFGLFCYHCRGSIHLECFYSVKRFAGIDCTQSGCAIDLISRRPRNRLVYPDEGSPYESNTNRIYRMRAGHLLQLVNTFSTCLCSVCKLPLWGHHLQAYRCQECLQLMHLDCKGIALECGGNASSGVFSSEITYENLRQSFLEFYQDIITSWRSSQTSASTPGMSRYSTTGPPSPAAMKDKIVYEEASCNASVLTIQLELLKIGMTRGEIRVLDWIQDGQATDQSLMETSGFELLAIKTYFTELAQQLLNPEPASGISLFLSDFYEDSKPDQFLLFSELYWGHFAAIAKTMINDSDAVGLDFRHPFFSYSNEWNNQEDDIFEHEPDAAQEQLLAGHSVRSANITLSSLFRFCMRRLGFKSSWTMQMILQEWVKMGLLERLDGELFLFEVSTMDPITPLPAMPVFRTINEDPPPVAPLSTALPTFQTSSYDHLDGMSAAVTYRSVHCLFPIVTAIDPTPDVENLIHSIWRCLSSVNLSINECGFLLLTRQCWPDPFMSDYTAERLVGCIFHWLLLEDDQLVVIHKTYASKGKKLPGVRTGLEEQLAVKRAVTGFNISGTGISDGVGISTETGASAGTMTAVVGGTGINPNSNVNHRYNSIASNLFGSVGAYVMTRKLLSKKFALPWLKKIMDLDVDRYKDMCYRQIRIIEREMAPEAECDAFVAEDKEKFQHDQKERYLESITKLRHAGFLFDCFPDVLCQWLAEVEKALEGKELSSKSFKSLNRLFLKASSRTGSGLGLGSAHPTIHPSSSEHSSGGSMSRATGGKLGDSDWRTRIKTKLHNTASKGSIHSQSPTETDRIPDSSSASGQESVSNLDEDLGETPLGTIRAILEYPYYHGVEGALRWLSLLVQSGVSLPTLAFIECGEALTDMAHASDTQVSAAEASVPSVSGLNSAPLRSPLTNTTPITNSVGLAPGLSPFQHTSFQTNNAKVLHYSQMLLKSCWESLITTPQHMSESEAEQILDSILEINQGTVARIMHDRTHEIDPLELENARQLLQYSLGIFMFASGCPMQAILDSHIIPSQVNTESANRSYTTPSANSKGIWPTHQQLFRRQHYAPSQQVALDKETVAISLFLKSLHSRSLSIQGEVIKCFSILLDDADRVSNMDYFVDSIHKEMLLSLWELLSPLNDHMADTTLPLLMHFAFIRPGYLHKTVAHYFEDPDWEVRFSALDSVFGLFSKLDDAQVMRLFFQQPISNTAHFNAKGKGVDRGHNHSHQKKTGTISQESDFIERHGAGLNGSSSKTYHRSTFVGKTFSDPGQQLGQFQPDHLQILGPIFSHFVSSMWDKEEAVCTKAKTLLKSLQRVHVVHALKAWELHFIASPPEVQQTLLKLMSRLNHYFPDWKIMDYGLIFQLLTSGELGQTSVQASNASVISSVNSDGSGRTSVVNGDNYQHRRSTLDTDQFRNGTLSADSDAKGLGSRRASYASMSILEKSDEAYHHHHTPGLGSFQYLHKGRRASFANITSHDRPMMLGDTFAADQSRRQRRASIISIANSLSVVPLPAMEDMEAREKQLELEDDIHCSLLNLALQMVANGIEPRLDEVIQLKYLVVFYLDFEGCELVGIGQGKFQVRYGEYIPRRRTSPIHQGIHAGPAGSSLDDVLNDPGHENFVLTICMNLQHILDRYVEIKPDHEEDSPTLYDQHQSRPMTPAPGGIAGNGFEATGTPLDLNSQYPINDRTFSSTTATTTSERGKESNRETMTTSQQDTNDNDEDHQRQQGLFCFPRQKNYSNDPKRSGDSRMSQNSAPQKNPYHKNPNIPIYQQQHHHHYRRKSYRHYDENTPVVGTYFVDVILRFFGSETDLATLPPIRLKNWLELLLIVIYKYVKEVDPLSDLVVVLMKRIVEMLMVKKSGPNVAVVVPAPSHNGAGTGVNGSATDPAVDNTPTGAAVPTPTPAVGEESMSEENILLAISICSTLLTRSSTMTTALLSREIMAMGKLMTKRRDDPDDPVLNRAKNFLHDAFVQFMGSGLFVLVFKTQPATNISSQGWEEEVNKVDQELDLFYVLSTVLGEDEMVLADPTDNTAPSGANRLVHIRDQPIRDILDRVTIFRDLEPMQVSTILTNLALYIERVHSKCQDPNLISDMGHFLIKITKYTAEWDQQQIQKDKEQVMQLRQAQEQLLLQHHHHLKHSVKRRGSQPLLSGNTSTMVSTGSSMHMSQFPQQKQGVMSVTSGGSTLVASVDRSSIAIIPPLPEGHPLAPARPIEAQRANATTFKTLTPTNTNMSALSALDSHDHRDYQDHQDYLDHQDHQDHHRQVAQQSTMPSSSSIAPTLPGIIRQPTSRRKSVTLKQVTSLEREHNPYIKYRHHHTTGFNQHLTAAQKRSQTQHWNYVNPVLCMCSILMIQNPFEGHHLISAVKHILRQALYRDRISAPALIRVVTGYCFIAEQDFSLPLVNAFGEFVVQELKASIQSNSHTKHDEEAALHEDELDATSDPEDHHYHRHRLKRASWKESDKDGRRTHSGNSSPAGSGSPLYLARSHVGTGAGIGSAGAGGHGRSKILAHNFHVLHHLLMWDVDPSYNMEWTRIKWEILGSMRFPPGQPILFPGANDVLREITASIIEDWVET
ncbi:hypothetical protein FBU30_010811 [Linnemannia zychae]|nr:hypothetical protein FBU30_010811 [Linnemannia zychae]